MNKDELARAILVRLYGGLFVPGMSYIVNLPEYAGELEVTVEEAWEAFDDLIEHGFAEHYAAGGQVRITSWGVLYCEEQRLVDDDLLQHQQGVRTQVLDTAARLQEQRGRHSMIPHSLLCSEADVVEQDFANNCQLLIDIVLLEPVVKGYFQITATGLERVADYRRRKARLERFHGLIALDGTTPQQRGHQLEDLLEELARGEEWEVEKRVRAQGTENDLILHRGLHYFLVSCKWEKDPIQAQEVELLESRVRSRASTNGGLLVSMSGFTDNAVEEARFKINSAHTLLFGPQDVERLFLMPGSLTELLESKLEQAMDHRKILVDGEAR